MGRFKEGDLIVCTSRLAGVTKINVGDEYIVHHLQTQDLVKLKGVGGYWSVQQFRLVQGGYTPTAGEDCEYMLPHNDYWQAFTLIGLNRKGDYVGEVPPAGIVTLDKAVVAFRKVKNPEEVFVDKVIALVGGGQRVLAIAKTLYAADFTAPEGDTP